MKYPKNRSDVFVVVRGETDAICGVFVSLEEADNFAGACEQEWLEKTGTKTPFFVRLSTLYL